MLQQFLYFIVAEMMCCSNVQGFQHPVTDAQMSYTDVLCMKMMEVNMEIDKNGFPSDQRNIFLENISLCGMMGYSDFYKPRWYTTILSWQQTSGCFDVNGKCSKHQTVFGGAALVGFLRFYATNDG
ncbi:UPF0764 protein C16orf89 homolog [Amblyraja radiata]|uniref:UPF0764 protein C16orf89 homolog n=1 Tax=Amblyraja radiata TaxID=386614 RepID=UPI0014042048|nr:UPF0764 protein C16orf89 homolog [Amblyraja radiata]